MKRLISTLLTVMMVFTLATPAFAIEASNDRFTTISNAFGIPTDALYTLDSATINLYTSMQSIIHSYLQMTPM